MAEIAKRDYILGYCDRMKVEQHRIFRRVIVDAAWDGDAVAALKINLGRRFDVKEMPNGEIEVHRIG